MSSVYIDFVARGIPDISRAFRSVETIVTGSERAQLRAVASGARAKEREYAKLAREAERWQKQMVREADKAAKAETRAKEKAAKEQIRIWLKSDRDLQRIRDGGVRAAEKAARAEARAFEAGEREKNRSAARWLRQREAEQRRFADRIHGAAGRGVTNAFRGGYSAASRVAGTLTQLGGGFSIADAVSGQSNLERQAALLANSAYIPGKTERLSTGRIVNRVKASSITTGIDAADLMEGLNAYTAKSADYAGGEKNLDFYGRAAKATGASVSDVMRTAGTLKVQNKELSAEALKQLTLSTIMQARQGSVEFEDMAAAGGKITRTAVSYAGDQGENQRKLLGLSQIGMKTAGNDVAEAATNIANLSADALKHKDDVAAVIGKDFMNKKGQITKDPAEFIAEIMAKTGGNLAKIQEMGFGLRSIKMFQAVAGTFNEAEAKAGVGTKAGRAAGKAAVLAEINDVTSTKYTEDDLQRDFANVMKTSAEQFEQSVRQLKTVAGEQLMPEFVKLSGVLQQLVPTVKRALDGFISIADWVAGNPVKAMFIGLGGLITKEVLMQVASAKIGELLRVMLGGGAGANALPVAGKAVGGMGLLGKAGLVVGAGVGAGYLTEQVIDYGFGKEAAKTSTSVERQIAATNLLSGAKGPLTGNKREQAQSLYSQLQSDFERQKRDMDSPSLIKSITGGMGMLVNPDATREAGAKDQAEQTRTLAATKAAMDALARALDRNTEATNANSGSTKSGGAKAPDPINLIVKNAFGK